MGVDVLRIMLDCVAGLILVLGFIFVLFSLWRVCLYECSYVGVQGKNILFSRFLCNYCNCLDDRE